MVGICNNFSCFFILFCYDVSIIMKSDLNNDKNKLKRILNKIRKGGVYSCFVTGNQDVYRFVRLVGLNNMRVISGDFKRKAYKICMSATMQSKKVKGREMTGFGFVCYTEYMSTK